MMPESAVCLVCRQDRPPGLYDTDTKAAICCECRDNARRLGPDDGPTREFILKVLKPFVAFAELLSGPDGSKLITQLGDKKQTATLTIGDLRWLKRIHDELGGES